MKKRVLITGATGFIGKKIAGRLIDLGCEITIVSGNIDNAKEVIPAASAYVEWNYRDPLPDRVVREQNAVIHLAGENLADRRWSEKQKKKIRESRINSTNAIVNAMINAAVKDSVFVSASAVGFYGHSEEEADETSKAGTGFLAGVVRDWENETALLDSYGIRRINVRAGLVLDKNGGALSKLMVPFQLFIGGPLGSGNQWMPWIHIEDLVEIFLLAIESERLFGPVNGVSPNPVRMKEFCMILSKVMHRPSYMRVPEFVIKLIMGESAALVLDGAKVIPRKLLEMNFKFKYQFLKQALEEIVARN